MPKKTLEQLLPRQEILNSHLSDNLEVTGVSQNSATVVKGSLYFAVRGTKVDGHAFIEQALSQGAAAVVVDREASFKACPKAVLVSSSRAALARSAARWYDEPSHAFDLVGVTGTNGKTTTTFLLEQSWRALGYLTGMIGTVETRVGNERKDSRLTTPDALTLQRLFGEMRDAGVKLAAMEVSSIALAQDRPLGTRFRVAVFTNLTPDHLDYHGDMPAYFEEKKKLFTSYRPDNSVINLDDSWGRSLANALKRKITFSFLDASADFFVPVLDLSHQGLRASIKTPVGLLPLSSPLVGKHNAENLLAALATHYALGLDLPKAASALSLARGAPGRLERVATPDGGPTVFVDYAHTEDALKNVLTCLKLLPKPAGAKIITVFGCGGDRDKGKRPRMGAVVEKLSDSLVLTSDNPRTEDPIHILDNVAAGIGAAGRARMHRDPDRRAAIYWALKKASPDDIVLIAGKGHETYQEIGTERFAFDDREVVLDFYRVG